MFRKRFKRRELAFRRPVVRTRHVPAQRLWRKFKWLALGLFVLWIAARSLGTDDGAETAAPAACSEATADFSEEMTDDLLLRHEGDDLGELKGDLEFLRGLYTTPEEPRESNFCIDLWEGNNLRALTRSNGLTNNHTLFINAHGKRTDNGRYALYPHQKLVAKDSSMPFYTMADLAEMMGPKAVSRIHNFVLSACNSEGALDAKEIRKAFPNVTNIIHSASGELGYQAMFFQALMNHSSKVKPIYEWSERNTKGEVEYLTAPVPTRNAKRFAPYICQLFNPGEDKPFAVQRAGRELLEPQRFENVASAK